MSSLKNVILILKALDVTEVILLLQEIWIPATLKSFVGNSVKIRWVEFSCRGAISLLSWQESIGQFTG